MVKPLRPSVTYFRNLFSPSSSIKASDSSNVSLSQQLLNSIGFISTLSPGTHAILPLAERSLEKLINLIDSEMKSIGAQRVTLPSLVSSSMLQKSNRLEEMKKDLFFIASNSNKDELLLAPTHEEVVTHLMSTVSGSISYKSLPICLYQIGPKYRNEKRPRGGLLRSREFIMKDLYSFDWNEDQSKVTYDKVTSAYKNLFRRLELNVVQASAHPGNIGGSVSHEYHIVNNAGQDVILICSSCGNVSNIELERLQGEEKEKEGEKNRDKPTMRSSGTSASHEENKEDEMHSCPSCHSSQVMERKGIEVAHTFLLGSRYSSPFNVKVTSPKGKSDFVHMGCYGIGVSRLLAASVECQSNDGKVKWPQLIAPFDIVLVPPKNEAAEFAFGSQFVSDLALDLAKITGLDVLIDDRTEIGIGKRDKDHLSRGIPFIVNAGRACAESVPKLELLNTASIEMSTFNSKEQAKLLTHCELFDYFTKVASDLTTLRTRY